jgi:murein DD-endopeptidase MepM/ murein hydrolase activator NlpD
MSDEHFQHVLLRLKRSELFQKLSHLRASSEASLFIALFSVTFFSVSLFLFTTSRQVSSEHPSNSLVQTILKSIGLASDTEPDTNNGDQNDPSQMTRQNAPGKEESGYTILTAPGLTPAEVQQMTEQLEKLTPRQETIAHDTRIVSIKGTIQSSMANELHKRHRSSLNPKLNEILDAKFDFAKDIRAGATYQILFQEQWNGSQFIGTGDILAVEISSKGRNFNAYLFTNDTGETAYYDENGWAMLQVRTMFIQPCRYSRISSGFGYRIHPITGRSEFHAGVDLVAPIGTPVFAVADGRIVFSGWYGYSGNMIAIAHDAARIQTMYLHLSGFSPAVRYGNTVKQGDIIGYVGSTGNSTGPHLDFRIVKNGQWQNPLLTLQQPMLWRSLSSIEFQHFMAKVQTYHEQLGKQTPDMVGQYRQIPRNVAFN